MPSRNEPVLWIASLAMTAFCSFAQQDPGPVLSWTATGRLNTPRFGHTATLLSDGQVLVIGGFKAQEACPIGTAEIYDPNTGTWRVGGALNFGRYGHTATLLPDGQVLVAGGGECGFRSLSSAELYDPNTGTARRIGDLTTPRYFHSATLLTNGKVLMVGGSGGQSAELYDPVTETFGRTGETGPFDTPGVLVQTALLPDGKVFAIGIYTAPSQCFGITKLFDPVVGRWSAANSPRALGCARTVTPLADGRVLATGTMGAEVFHPATGEWSVNSTYPLRFTFSSGAALHGGSYTATRLKNDQVLITGGFSDDYSDDGAGIFDPATGIWSAIPALRSHSNASRGRANHTATLLANGKVLIAGGASGYCCDVVLETLDTAELFDPGLSGSTVANVSPARNR